MQTAIKVPNVILRYNVPRILHPLSQFGNGFGRLWRNSKFPLHHVSYVFNLREIWDSCWPGQLLYTTQSTGICVAVTVRGRALSCWKSTLPSRRTNDNRTGLTQCSGHCLLYPAKTPNVTASFNWWPHPEAWGGACLSWANALLMMTLTSVVHSYVRHLKTDRIYSHHWRQQSDIPLQLTLLPRQSSLAWRCRGVSGSLACCKQISSLDALRAATAARRMSRTWVRL